MGKIVVLLAHISQQLVETFEIMKDDYGVKLLDTSGLMGAVQISEKRHIDIAVIGDSVRGKGDMVGMKKTLEAFEQIKSKRKVIITDKKFVAKIARKRGITVYEEPVYVEELLYEEIKELKGIDF